MKRVLLSFALVAILAAFTGCTQDIIGSREYDAVHLTTLSNTTGAPLDADVVTVVPSHTYSTGADGFTQLKAEFGQDKLTADITFWTLPPSISRSKTVTFNLSNKAITRRISLEDDPYERYAGKISPNILVLNTEYVDDVEQPASPMTLCFEEWDEGSQSWQPASIDILEDGSVYVE